MGELVWTRGNQLLATFGPEQLQLLLPCSRVEHKPCLRPTGCQERSLNFLLEPRNTAHEEE